MEHYYSYVRVVLLKFQVLLLKRIHYPGIIHYSYFVISFTSEEQNRNTCNNFILVTTMKR